MELCNKVLACHFRNPVVVCVCVFFFPLRAASMAYGGSQARGCIRAVATSLHLSHSNEGCKPHLQPTPQLTAMLEP